MDSKGTAGQDAGAWHGTGFIYVLTNPSFPAFVKIGYADDPAKRVKALNRNPVLPSPFRLYCTLQVPERMTDRNVHAVIDRIVPGLRATGPGDVQGTREFYRMPPEQAYAMLDGIATVSGIRDGLRLHGQNEATGIKADSRLLQEYADAVWEDGRALGDVPEGLRDAVMDLHADRFERFHAEAASAEAGEDEGFRPDM